MADDPQLTTSEGTALVEQIATLIEARYVFADAGQDIKAHLQRRLAEGVFDRINDSYQLAETLTRELFSTSRDHHLRVTCDDDLDTAMEPLEHHFLHTRNNNYGFISARRLIGNIGYLEIHELAPVEAAGFIVQGAMAFLSEMRALILDLCLADGGSSEMVQFIISYLVDQPQPISGVQWRSDDTPVEQWTLDGMPGRRLSDVDIYILTSGYTHSAAEALAYDLKALGRATIIGEKTRGGAHLTSVIPLTHGFVLHLPEGRAINPITGTNWERMGVIPDIELPQQRAFDVAHHHALKMLLDRATDPEEQRFLQWEMASLEAKLRPVTIDPGRMASFSGSYGDWQITIGDGGLYARLHTTFKLTAVSKNTFQLADAKRLRFLVDDDDNVYAMQVLERDGRTIRLERTS